MTARATVPVALVALLLAPAASVQGLPIVNEFLTEPRPYAEAPAPALPDSGEKVVVQFKLGHPWTE